MILALHSMCIDIDSDAFQVEVILEGRYCVDLSLVASTQCGSREQLRTRKKYCISNYIECILMSHKLQKSKKMLAQRQIHHGEGEAMPQHS